MVDLKQSISQSISPAIIQKFLGGIDYPASKQDLINHAKKSNADESVLGILNKIPDQQFNSPADVSKAIGMVK